MNPFIFTWIALALLAVQLQGTFSTNSEDVEAYVDNDTDLSYCYSRKRMRVYLAQILQQIEHPGSVLMLTDCISEFSFEEDIQLFSYISFAFMSKTMANEIKEGRWTLGESKPFIVIDLLPEDESGNAAGEIIESYHGLSHQITKWQPTIFIIFERDVRNDNEMERLSQVFEDIPLDFDCNLFALYLNMEMMTMMEMPSSPYDERAVWEIYNIKEKRIISKCGSILMIMTNGATSVTDIGVHMRSVLSLESIAKRRRNFQLESLTASVKYDPSFSDWIGMEKKEGGNGSYRITKGYVAQLYWDLQMLMNFSDNVIIGDSPWVFPNGSLGGITVQQLNKDLADLSLNQVSYSPHRAKSLTFLHPTYYSFIHVFFKQPSQNSIRDIVTAAFRKELWMTLIGVWAILVISVKIRFFLLRQNYYTPLSCSFQFLKDYGFSNEGVLWSVAALCQKSWYMDPYSTSLRMKFMIGSIVSVMVYTAYSAAICSSLAVNHVPVKNLIDLISFNFIFTVHERSEPFQTMLKGMIESYNMRQDVVTVSTVKEISHLYSKSSTIASEIRSTRKAFLSSADMFYKTALLLNYSDSFICDHISSMHAGSYLTKSAMLVKKNSQFKEVLNYMLAYLMGRGLIFRNIERYNTKNFLRCIPIDQKDKSVEPAELSDVFTVVLVLFVGMPVAILVLLMEVIHRTWSDRNAGGRALCKRRKRNVSPNHAYFDYDGIASFLYTA